MQDQALSFIHNSSLTRIADDLTNLLRNTISITTYLVDRATELPLGSSKIGGIPDLPPTIPWPEWDDQPIPFIAQINLADNAPYDYAEELPHTGMLFFFFNDEALCTYPPTRESWCVIYYDGDISELRRMPIASEKQLVYPICSVKFSTKLTLPPFESLYIERLGLSYDAFQQKAPIEQKREADAYQELDRQLDMFYERLSPYHQLLGHPIQIQGDLLWECQQDTHYEGNPTDWRLLLQIDSDDEAAMMWGDVGILYFYIPQQALAVQDFSQVHLIMQCT